MQTEKQRERLVEIAKGFCRYEKCSGKEDSKYCKECENGGKLADYLMSNNVVVLPCVVGQTVWCICNYEKPKEFHISVLSMSENHYSFTIEANKGVFKHYCDKDAVGKWVFFTKEEAENVLKERKNGT